MAFIYRSSKWKSVPDEKKRLDVEFGEDGEFWLVVVADFFYEINDRVELNSARGKAWLSVYSFFFSWNEAGHEKEIWVYTMNLMRIRFGESSCHVETVIDLAGGPLLTPTH